MTAPNEPSAAGEESGDLTVDRAPTEPAPAKEYWFYAGDEEDEELFGVYDTKASAIEAGALSFFGTRFVVREGHAMTEEDVDERDLAAILQRLNDTFMECGGAQEPAFAIMAENEGEALVELRAWLKKWCAPSHVVPYGETITIGADGKEIEPKVELVRPLERLYLDDRSPNPTRVPARMLLGRTDVVVEAGDVIVVREAGVFVNGKLAMPRAQTPPPPPETLP
jgi:hypothetical protein